MSYFISSYVPIYRIILHYDLWCALDQIENASDEMLLCVVSYFKGFFLKNAGNFFFFNKKQINLLDKIHNVYNSNRFIIYHVIF